MALGKLILHHDMDDSVESQIGQVDADGAVVIVDQVDAIKFIKRQPFRVIGASSGSS